MATELQPYEERVRVKHRHARNEALWVVIAGALLHMVGLWGAMAGPIQYRLIALLFVMFGALLIFGGLMAVYTYFENIEERDYLPGERVGIGSDVEIRRPA